MSKTYHIGISGLRRGLSLARVFPLFPDCQIAAGCDLDPQALERFGQHFPQARLCSTYGEMLEAGLDVVVVASPIPDHKDQSIAALEAGCHVLQEVILGATIEECAALLKAVQGHPRQLFMLAENCCYWGHILAWKEMWAQGMLGELVYAEAEYVHDVRALHRNPDRTPTWRSFRQPLTYCTHSLGPLLKITGERCARVTALATANKIAPEYGQCDFGVGIIQTTSGAVIKILRAEKLVREPSFHYYSLYGTKGCLETSRPPVPLRTHAYLEQVPHMSTMMELPLGYDVPGAPAQAKAGGHGTAEYCMIGDFLDALRQGRPAPIDIQQALDMSLPGLCAQESIRQGGVPVEVPDWR
ncbi:MAG: Gfo/Idh/MocA family oxidoreductase [Candidatus Handelsmanbacteria bacterium]|nr:Gfo/Idh/MocA family oxidoreductase [Candidatus Handelsmanbacteria bacterium]